MSLYPEVQAAAQKELDTIIGTDHLPKIADCTQLPYMMVLCKEVFCWHVASPTGSDRGPGIPHRARPDFIYDCEGSLPLFIPKDSLITPNIWLKMIHDPDRYANPMAFDPTRFIPTAGKAAEQDPVRMCFSFGRCQVFTFKADRETVGKILADTTVFMACSTILAVFNMTKARENGVVVEPPVGQADGTV
ncbi:cytochrome P450, partial [Mycena maculata]